VDDVYEGSFNEEGKREGKGKLTFVNKDVYEGDFKNGKQEGKGKYTFVSRDVYEGKFENDKREGIGKYTFASGNVYEGEFKNDKREGIGKFRFASGDVYEGDFKNGKVVINQINYAERDKRIRYTNNNETKNGILKFKFKENDPDVFIKECEGLFADKYKELYVLRKSEFIPKGVMKMKTEELRTDGKGELVIVQCPVCFTNNAGYMENCRHTICADCYEKVPDCPFCREEKSTLRKFIQQPPLTITLKQWSPEDESKETEDKKRKRGEEDDKEGESPPKKSRTDGLRRGKKSNKKKRKSKSTKRRKSKRRRSKSKK